MNTKSRTSLVLVLGLVLLGGCAKAPPILTPGATIAFHANQVVVAIGTLQHAAIELNKVQLCDPMPCHPLLSDKNTGVVVDASTDALNVLKVSPDGWRATSLTALDRVKQRLDTAGHQSLDIYVSAAQQIIAAQGTN